MTYEVQQTRWDRIIRRVSGSIGPGSRVSETLSELFPVLDVEQVPSELLFLGGTQICMGRSATAAVAGQFAQSMIRNPGGSGVIITVTQAVIFPNNVSTLRAGLTLNTFAVAGTKQIRDGRGFPNSIPSGAVLSDSLLVPVVDFFRVRANSTESVYLTDSNDLAVLPPGTAFAVGNSAANIALDVGWFWRERPAEEAELQF